MPSIRRAYEPFLLTLQLLPRPAILPQLSADTSKAVSNLKDGALYGFFFETAVSRDLSLLELSMFKSHVSRFF